MTDMHMGPVRQPGETDVHWLNRLYAFFGIPKREPEPEMSDIVERLRKWGSRFHGELLNDAADEIERLRQEVELLRRDNHSLWGSLRNRMAADVAGSLPR